MAIIPGSSLLVRTAPQSCVFYFIVLLLPLGSLLPQGHSVANQSLTEEFASVDFYGDSGFPSICPVPFRCMRLGHSAESSQGFYRSCRGLGAPHSLPRVESWVGGTGQETDSDCMNSLSLHCLILKHSPVWEKHCAAWQLQ